MIGTNFKYQILFVCTMLYTTKLHTELQGLQRWNSGYFFITRYKVARLRKQKHKMPR